MRLNFSKFRRIVLILCVYHSIVESSDFHNSRLPHSYTYEGITPQNIRTGCRGTFYPESKQTHQVFHVIDATGIPKYVEPGSTVQITFPIINNGPNIQSYKKQFVHFNDICFPSQCNAPSCGNSIGPLTAFTATSHATGVNGNSIVHSTASASSSSSNWDLPTHRFHSEGKKKDCDKHNDKNGGNHANLNADASNSLNQMLGDAPEESLAPEIVVPIVPSDVLEVSEANQVPEVLPPIQRDPQPAALEMKNESESNKMESVITATSTSGITVTSSGTNQDGCKCNPNGPQIVVTANSDAAVNNQPGDCNPNCQQSQAGSAPVVSTVSMPAVVSAAKPHQNIYVDLNTQPHTQSQTGNTVNYSPMGNAGWPFQTNSWPWFPFGIWGKNSAKQIKPNKNNNNPTFTNIIKDANYYSSLPGSIFGSTHVIYYASCEKDAFYQPAIVSYCPTPIPQMMDTYQKDTKSTN